MGVTGYNRNLCASVGIPINFIFPCCEVSSYRPGCFGMRQTEMLVLDTRLLRRLNVKMTVFWGLMPSSSFIPVDRF